MKRAKKLVGTHFYLTKLHFRILYYCKILQTCFYCKLRGASIGCSRKCCRKSFHLICGLENKCSFQFCGKFEAACHLHHALERSGVHAKTEVCRHCSMDMGDFNIISSIEYPCCSSRWRHISCMKRLAFEKRDDFCCDICGDADMFRQFMLTNGIYIPNGLVYGITCAN